MKKNIILLACSDDRLRKTVNIILRRENYIVSLLDDISEIARNINEYRKQENTVYLLIYILPFRDLKSLEAITLLQKKLKNLLVIIIYDFLDNPGIYDIKREQKLKCTFLEKSFDAGTLVETISRTLKEGEEHHGIH